MLNASAENFREAKNSNRLQKPLQSMNEMQKMKDALMSKVNSIISNTHKYKASQWFFDIQIKHQVLILTIILIMIVVAMFIGINHVQMNVFSTLLSTGFDQMLVKSNANFQASFMIKYMSLTQNFFEKNQQVLMAIKQLYDYALKSQYSIDLGLECPILNSTGRYPTYSQIDSFCYLPHAASDLQTFKNSTLNTEFVKLTNILNQFILCFSFQQSFSVKNILQINLDNQEQMSSYYPQSSPFKGYLPAQRPFFIYQKQQHQSNTTKKFYLSKYQQTYTRSGAAVYGQTLTLSLLNRTQFQGVIAVTITFGIFDAVLQKFPDVNLALVALDGTMLFQQNQMQKYDRQQYIFNQSYTGYNYLDWLNLSAHKDFDKQIIMNNTLFSEPIKVNIKQFNELPYYFVVYNNLTYEKQIKNIQTEILNKIMIEQKKALFELMILFIILIIAVYFLIQLILKPLKIIRKIIYCYDEHLFKYKQFKELKQTNNILYILQFIIYVKYSELQNLSFRKSLQCQQIEDLQYQIKQSRNKEIALVRYLLQYKPQTTNKQLEYTLKYQIESNYTQSQSVPEFG